MRAVKHSISVVKDGHIGWSVEPDDGEGDFELKFIINGKYVTSGVIPATIEFNDKDMDTVRAFDYCIHHFGYPEKYDFNSRSYMWDFETVEKGIRDVREKYLMAIHGKTNSFHSYPYLIIQWLGNF